MGLIYFVIQLKPGLRALSPIIVLYLCTGFGSSRELHSQVDDIRSSGDFLSLSEVADLKEVISVNQCLSRAFGN